VAGVSTDPNDAFRAGNYEPGMLAFWDRVLTAFYRSLPGRARGARLLDVGAGRGLLVSLARADGLDAHGVEPFWPNPMDDHVVRGVAESLPFADASFDIVTCFSVIEYVERPDAALAEMGRVLKAEGRVVIAVPELAAYRGLRRERYRHVTSGRWLREVVAGDPRLVIGETRGLGVRYLVPIGKRTIGRIAPAAASTLLAMLYARRYPLAVADLTVLTLGLRASE
jgi:SAM-dependent methyltransferase